MYPPESGDIDHPLQRMADEHAGIAARAAAQPAQTRYRRLATEECHDRLKAELWEQQRPGVV